MGDNQEIGITPIGERRIFPKSELNLYSEQRAYQCQSETLESFILSHRQGSKFQGTVILGLTRAIFLDNVEQRKPL